MQAPDLNSLLNGLEQKISSRDAQLAALENALLSKKLDEQIRPDGRPVREGHISSTLASARIPSMATRPSTRASTSRARWVRTSWRWPPAW
jgi:hypothetical protein